MTPPARSRLRAWFWLASIVCAALSLLQTGFRFPYDNNVFHVPIVLGLVDLPQFADDPIIQSLRDFTAPLYRLMALVGREDTIAGLFLAAQILTRLAAMAALLAAALAIAGWSRATLAAAAAALAGLDLLNGYALIGGHGLFINHFTHSEAALPLVVLALHLMARGRTVAALAACGALFNVNAFVAVWTGAALLGAAWGRPGGFGQGRDWRHGLALALLLALPTLAWIVRVQAGAGPSPIADFREFLRFYYPGHFFIDAAGAVPLACLAGLAAIGWLALDLLGANARGWRCALMASLLLLVAGAVAPLLTAAPLVLNLHLIRAAGMVHIIAMVAMVALAAAAATPGFGALRRLGVLATLLPLTLNVAAPGLVGVSLLACAATTLLPRAAGLRECGAGVLHALRRGGGQRILRPAMTTLLVLLFGAQAVALRVQDQWRSATTHHPAQDDFAALVRWARTDTDPSAVFLIRGTAPEVEPFMFPVLAHRRLWVDRKSGAAALWRPSVYPEWRRRLETLRSLPSTEAALRLACTTGIDYVIAFEPPRPDLPAAFARNSVVAIAVAPHCAKS